MYISCAHLVFQDNYAVTVITSPPDPSDKLCKRAWKSNFKML